MTGKLDNEVTLNNEKYLLWSAKWAIVQITNAKVIEKNMNLEITFQQKFEKWTLHPLKLYYSELILTGS